MGCDFGSHAIRQYFDMQKHASRFAAVLFVDCSSAFYVVIRQMITEMDWSDECFAHMMASLDMLRSALDEVIATIENPALFIVEISS